MNESTYMNSIEMVNIDVDEHSMKASKNFLASTRKRFRKWSSCIAKCNF